jgi:hypothetical protein
MKNKWAAMLVSLAMFLAMPLVHADEQVVRSVITSAVVDREPVDDLITVPSTVDNVVFFTELRNMEGQTIMHRWMFGDEQMAEVSFPVGGPRWRVWSSKKMMPEWVGGWKVQVINGAGEVIAEKAFTYAMAEDAGMETASEGGEPAPEEKLMAEEAPMPEAAPEAEGMSGEGAAQ